jgi:UDP-N-acetylglucosamine diphosphorylase / glucose-1-phosphate thymidylyltransferase / UDP-N-acetylgalactosamine diphosphorylase / glucosamine-1-phosphate N-acetyltransferase / galactosamine-1-phosphate N-acetyltransferase
MKPLTDKTPKPLLEVLGKPLLEYNLDAVSPFSEEIIIVVGYLGDQIKKRFGNTYCGKPIQYVEQKEQLGTGHALLCAENYLHDRFIVLLGDDFNTSPMIEKAMGHRYCVIAMEVKEPRKFGILETQNGIIVGLEEKPLLPKSNLANTGAWIMDRKLIDIMKKQEPSPRSEFEITDALRALIRTEKVHCEIIKGGWIPVGYPADLITVEDYLKGEKNGAA